MSLFAPEYRPATAPQALRHAPFLHPCEVCGAWGAFGFGRCRAADQRWFCGAHRGEGEKLL